MSINELIGKTLSRCEKIGDDRIEFETTSGDKYAMAHYQDCCESVVVDDICGDLQNLVGEPILQAEENTNSDKIGNKPEYAESFTWTFYRLATIKGSVVIRWLGQSNGYYSENVDFYKV